MFRKYSAQHIGKTAVDATRDYLSMNAPTSDRAMPAPAEGRIDQVTILGRLPCSEGHPYPPSSYGRCPI